jgi:hypothetical protein
VRHVPQREAEAEASIGTAMVKSDSREAPSLRVRHHCKVPGHIETGYENGLNVVSVLLVTGERNPRLVVALSIFSNADSNRESSLYVGYFVTSAAPRFPVSSNEKLAPGSRGLGGTF